MERDNMYRFIQTGDWHIGAGRNVLGLDKALARTEAMIREIYALAKKHNVDGVIIAGDIFDHKRVLPEERDLFASLMGEYAGGDGVPTYIIQGNHDMIGQEQSNLDWLYPFTEKELKNLNLTHPTRDMKIEVADGLDLWLVPAALSENMSWINENVKTVDKSTIFVGHALVSGSTVDSGYGLEGTFSLKEASRTSDIIWWAYGDIHKRQELATLNKKANGMYAGSPMQMNFGEENDKGVELVTLDKSDDKWVFGGTTQLRLTSPKPFIKLETGDEEIPDGAYVKICSGAVVTSSVRDELNDRILEDNALVPTASEVSGSLVDNMPSYSTVDHVEMSKYVIKSFSTSVDKKGRKSNEFKYAKKIIPEIIEEAIHKHRDML